MILLYQVVYVLALADLDRLTGFLLECLERRGIGAAFVDRDFVRQAVLPNRFLEEAPGGFLIAMGGEEEVDGLSLLIDSTVKVFPLPLDLNVGLVHPPARADRALLPFSESGFQWRGEFLDPAVDIRMLNLTAALCHHFLQVPVAEWIGQIPADTQQDDVFFEAVAFEVDHREARGAIH